MPIKQVHARAAVDTRVWVAEAFLGTIFNQLAVLASEAGRALAVTDVEACLALTAVLARLEWDDRWGRADLAEFA
jgi:hypothetical protein